MNLRLDEISNAVNGELLGPAHSMATGYSIDSRTLQPGDLFFAIKGPRFNGHDFVSEVLAKGAAAVVVNRTYSQALPGGVIKVDDTLSALQGLARTVRRRWGRPIVGVTGSAGKTTTKEMIADV